MKKNEFEKEIMDFLDGIIDEIPNVAVYQEGKDLKQILFDLKEIPFEKVSPETDRRIYRFIDMKRAHSRARQSKKWYYISAAAAIMILFFYVLLGRDSFEAEYHKAQNNPEKLSVIYSLHTRQLGNGDLKWLQGELKKDINPNIKVAIIDLLARYPSKLDKYFCNSLKFESIPSVQMALLNTVETLGNIDYSEELLAFSQREGLDNTVRSKANMILSEHLK